MSSGVMQVMDPAQRYVAGQDAQGVPLGYRHTELGMVPEDWVTVSCSDLVEPGAPICYGVVQVGPHVDGGIPIVAIKFVKEIASAPLHCASPSIERAYLRSRVQPGDVLLSIKGTIGQVGVVPEGFQGNISRELARLRPGQGLIPCYFAYQLESGATQERISRAVVGTTRLEFSIAALRKFEIPVPETVTEQRAIAEALSDVDRLLRALEALIAKKRAIKQAAMQQLLTANTRLPGFSGEWETKSVGEIAEVSKGVQLPSNRLNPGGHVPHYNGGVSPSGFTDHANTSASTIAISEGGNSCGYVQLIDRPFWCGGHCYAVAPRTGDNRFVFHALKAKEPALMGLRVGSGLPNVQKTALRAFQLRIPSDTTEQTAIATVLSDMDVEIAALEARRDKTRAIKHAMMQQLLTGRVRLVEAGAAA